jgi:catechol 2,3-dioxygenase-like lactoylglutathione lyase family enzyme
MAVELLVNIDVDDLERATRFYEGAFGFRVGRRFGDACVELLGGSAGGSATQASSCSAGARRSTCS